MKQSQQSNKRIRLFTTGFSMGLADLVPGVSGGTIAFLFGIYDELLFSIRKVSGAVPKLLIKRQFKEAIAQTPFSFLLPLGLGMMTAIFSMVKVVTYLLDNFPVYVWSFFFGLVLGSVYVVSKRVEKWNLRRGLLFVAGFGITYLVLGLPTMDGNTSLWALFITGAIAITAMILPGISGSLIMVILGQYETVINSISDRHIERMISFASGAAVGIAIFSRILSWLLKHYHTAVVVTMMGIMLGSLRKVWPWQIEKSEKIFVNELPGINSEFFIALSIIVGGFCLVYLLNKIGIANEHDDIESEEFIEEVHSAKN